MGVTLARALIGAAGVVMMLSAVGVAALGGGGADLVGAVSLFVPGALLVIVAILERLRYRSLAAELSGDRDGPGGGEHGRPEPRFRPTEERFVDPTTHLPMRVYVDPLTGEQRYVAEQ